MSIVSDYAEIYNSATDEKERQYRIKKKHVDVVWCYALNFLYSFISCKTDYANSLNYTWDELEELGGSESNEIVPSYICHLMELYPFEQTMEYYKRYWQKILSDTKSILEL